MTREPLPAPSEPAQRPEEAERRASELRCALLDIVRAASLLPPDLLQPLGPLSPDAAGFALVAFVLSHPEPKCAPHDCDPEPDDLDPDTAYARAVCRPARGTAL